MSVLALVLNYHQRERTREFIQHLADVDPTVTALVLVDNSEPPEFREGADQWPLPVTVLAIGTNRGVAGGRNLGIEAALASEYPWDQLAILDNDMTLPRGGIRALSLSLEAAPDCAVAGPCLVRADDPSVVQAMGGTVRVPFYPQYNEQGARLASIEGREPEDTEFLGGGAAIVRRDLLAGGIRFDERFNPYGPEDIDFCLQARSRGARVIVVPHVRFRHEGRGIYKRSFQHHVALARGDALLRLKWGAQPHVAVVAYAAWKLLRAVLVTPWDQKAKTGFGALLGVALALQQAPRPGSRG